MKKLICIFITVCVISLSAIPTMAAPAQQNLSNNITVEITSPSDIASVPIHNDTVDITVTNHSNTEYKDLACYLTVIDVDRAQTYPVDEFGENAYQTRTISSLAPGKSTVVSIPVRIMYVGNFRFTASVASYDTNQIATGKAISVKMTALSNLNKSLVMVVAACVPVVLLGVTLLLQKKRGHKKA